MTRKIHVMKTKREKEEKKNVSRETMKAKKTTKSRTANPRKELRGPWPKDRLARFQGDGEEMMFFPDKPEKE